jgi:integrase
MELHPPRRAVPLPKALSQDQLNRFFRAITESGVPEHELIFRIAFATGARVSELSRIRREHVDLTAATIRIEHGKGGKSRIVMVPASILLPLRVHMQSTPSQEYLFETKRKSRYSTRWIQVLASRYGDLAGIEDMHPHRLRHTVLTKLAGGITLPDGRRVRGMSDAQLQVVSGHSQRRSLEVYSQLSLSQVRDHYDALMDEGNH